MPFPPDEPDREYTDPVIWHEDPVYRIDGRTGFATNHEPDFLSLVGGPVLFHTSYDGNGFFTEPFAGEAPGAAGMNCAWRSAHVGYATGGLWGGECPESLGSPAEDIGGRTGTVWNAGFTTPHGGVDSAGATCGISGWLLRLWRIFDNYSNPYMGDSALQAEYNAAIAASSPGFGWTLELEANHPFLVGAQVAADEDTIITGGVRTEEVHWFYDTDPATWSFQGVDDDNNALWPTGLQTEGEQLPMYGGGLADWVDVPEAWLPTQNPDRFVCELIEPDVEFPDTEAIPFTLVATGILNSTPPSANLGDRGRTRQALMVRAAWQVPRLRWYRERPTDVVRQYPRDDERGWGSGTRLYPPTKANRIVGGIQ